MPKPFSMKVLHVRGARPEEKIFVPTPEATPQSLVFPSGPVDQSEAAAVGAKVGKGYLAYVGDVNGEQGSNEIVLALCGVGGN
jgi:hypothetical protein